MNPTGVGSPKFYGLKKIHKAGIPLRPIVSSRGAVSYETGNELARIMKPLVGKSQHLGLCATNQVCPVKTG